MEIKKKVIFIIIAMLSILLFIPLIFVSLLKPQDGMGMMIIFFFLVNPISAIIINLMIGTDIKKLWYIPGLFSLIFLLSYWLVLKEIILDLIIYAIIYLILGLISMYLSTKVK